MVINKGSRVLHNNVEKIVEEIAGDVLILNDKSVVRNSEIVIIAPDREVLGASLSADHKKELRRKIETLSTVDSCMHLMAIVKEIDGGMQVVPSEVEALGEFKKMLISKALALGKIDPKVCSHCGQVIAE
jgi:hypothetical protein